MKTLDCLTLAVDGLITLSSAVLRSALAQDATANFLSSLVAEVRSLDSDSARPGSSHQPPLTVDLGYARYEGSNDPVSGVNIWKGIRYAAPPAGTLRWQPPQSPLPTATDTVTPATTFGPICPQNYPAVPGLPFIPGNEDCLSLNVYAPADARDLPVLVYIHGGGYGYGDGRQDMSEIISANENGFIAVVIQYRLGAFGFLSSADVRARGVVNAGLLDQAFALGWVQKFIGQFGGDRKRVTIAGESAGAGSVMYHALAVDGGLGTAIFTNASHPWIFKLNETSIAASPYLPFHYTHDAAFPTERYHAFAEKAGCSLSGDNLECLRGKDSMTLRQASANTTFEETYGYWAFYPVTDGVYIRNLPSEQLSQKRVNGKRVLVGAILLGSHHRPDENPFQHNANEGRLFTPPNIMTGSDLTSWLALEFPNLSPSQIDEILAANPTKTGANDTRFETDGKTGLTAMDVSQSGTGQQQRANASSPAPSIMAQGYVDTQQNIYAEATFVCPGYWLSTAFTPNHASYHYQYSVPFASHTADITAYFGPATPNQGPDITLAIRKIWGNFVVTGNPSIANEIANGASSTDPAAPNGASNWPAWDEGEPKQANLNQTGGTAYRFVTQWGVSVTQFKGPGVRNEIKVVDADTWEGGRGGRCRLWRRLAASIPA
ncbi:carboxylesterase family protein [Colletotrichum incanum]|nr:carboxylesterase family protein [Colletotrichum incanum]